MTKFYSKSTNGFYDSEINHVIPAEYVEITQKQWQTLIDAQASGKVIKADKNGNPIAVDFEVPALTLDSCNALAQSQLDEIAQEWGYSSIVSAASYANSTNAQFKADAEALIAWRDNLWQEAYTIETGALPATADAFLAMLPSAPTKPVV